MVGPYLGRRSALATGVTAVSGIASAQTPAGGPLAAGVAGPFETQPWGSANRIEGPHYAIERITFTVEGTLVVGNLFLPNGGVRRPAVAMLGPVAFVKEQAPFGYATRLAREGIVALVFDPRHHGESGGEPRRLEDGARKAIDLRAALSYLATRPETDPDRLGLLGICQGVNWTIAMAAEEPRALRLALVAGHYLTPETALMYLGTPENVAARIARSRAAAERFRSDGTVEYLRIVQPHAEEPDPGALLTALPIHQFYIPWADRGPFRAYRGLWENRIAAMSEEGIWGHDVSPLMPRITAPLLMVHAERAASGPAIPRRLFDLVSGDRKRLVMLGARNQMQFYEDPLTLDLVVPLLARHFEGGSA